MYFEVSSNFKPDVDVPEAEEPISEARVYITGKDGEDFFLNFSYVFEGEDVSSVFARSTLADEEDFRSYISEFLSEPEIREYDEDSIFAIAEDERVTWDPEEDGGGIMHYHGNLSRLDDLYIEGKEPLNQDEYREAIDTALEELREGLDEIGVDPERISS